MAKYYVLHAPRNRSQYNQWSFKNIKPIGEKDTMKQAEMTAIRFVGKSKKIQLIAPTSEPRDMRDVICVVSYVDGNKFQKEDPVKAKQRSGWNFDTCTASRGSRLLDYNGKDKSWW